jgi:glutaredoxin-like protein NrdH
MKIIIWTEPNNVPCQQTLKQFDGLNIRYEERLLDPFKLDEFRAKGFFSLPIVQTDTKEWCGFRLDKIRSLAAHLKSLGEVAVTPAPGEVTREFYRKQGQEREQARIINWLDSHVCFDHRDTGFCTHNACYNNRDLVVFIREGK